MTSDITFTVHPKSAVVVAVQGFADADKLLVEYQTTAPTCPDTRDAMWIPFSPGGCQWHMTHAYNPKVFDTPGTYRLVFEAAPNTDPHFGVHTVIVDL
jgi:hypothetical protein